MSSDTIYDHPLYYDILFGFDRGVEAAFYERTLERCGVAPGASVLEVGAGPARIARLLARRGWRVTALDRSAAMLAYARQAAAGEGARLEVIEADMKDFRVARPFAAAYNPLSSFRLLHRDAAVDAHLRCMADAIAEGGVYVVDLALQAAEGDAPTTDDSWEMRRGAVTVHATNDGVTVRDGGVERRLAWGAEAHLRGYTASTYVARLATCPAFTIESWHPETGRPTGVSEFAAEGASRAPAVGRAMVVLRRRRHA